MGNWSETTLEVTFDGNARELEELFQQIEKKYNMTYSHEEDDEVPDYPYHAT